MAVRRMPPTAEPTAVPTRVPVAMPDEGVVEGVGVVAEDVVEGTVGLADDPVAITELEEVLLAVRVLVFGDDIKELVCTLEEAAD